MGALYVLLIQLAFNLAALRSGRLLFSGSDIHLFYDCDGSQHYRCHQSEQIL